MSIKNKILVTLWLESGCEQAKDEVSMSWQPINFSIYSNLFQDMVEEAVSQWLEEITIAEEVQYQLIMQHVQERDGAGAMHTEYFEPINVERD